MPNIVGNSYQNEGIIHYKIQLNPHNVKPGLQAFKIYNESCLFTNEHKENPRSWRQIRTEIHWI